MSEEVRKRIRFVIQCLPIITVASLVAVCIYAIHLGIFSSTESLHTYIKGFGEYAVIAFIVLQIIQVIVPILPGGISTVAGMLLFGPIWGMVYSYIGLVIGEVLAYYLVRYYGVGFVQMILSEKNFQKFEEYTKKSQKNIKKLIIATFLIPFAPDDIICFVAGLTKMKFKDYITIILILKPWSIGVYSYLMLFVVKEFVK